MAKNVYGINIPKDALTKVDLIKKSASLNHRTDAFLFMSEIQPIILGEKSIRLPKSKNILRQIDVRYIFKDKHEKISKK